MVGRRVRHGQCLTRRGYGAGHDMCPTGERITVVLRYYEDLSVERTAQSLGVREGTGKSNTARGVRGRPRHRLTAQGRGRLLTSDAGRPEPAAPRSQPSWLER
jgi:hypothetical protein